MSFNNAVIEFLTTDYDVVSTTAGLAAAVALVFLLVQREGARALGDDATSRRMRSLDVAVHPLALSFAVTVLLRLVLLLPIDGA